MNRRLFIAGAGLVLVAGPALAQAPANTLDEVKKRGVVKVGVRQDVPGFGIVDEKGETVGFDIDIANHIAGTRAIDMAAMADFDGDGVADIAAPSLDCSRLRLVSFAPKARDIADLPLPAKAVTNLALVAEASGPPAIAVGLADGSLAVIRRVP